MLSRWTAAFANGGKKDTRSREIDGAVLARPRPYLAAEPGSQYKTYFLVVLCVFTSVVGNAMLGAGMQQVGTTISYSPFDYVPALLNPLVLAGTLTLTIFLLSRLALLSRADLSFVMPLSASSYVLIALVGHFVLGEQIEFGHWAGILIIAVGVMLVGETPPQTSKDSSATTPEEERPASC